MRDLNHRLGAIPEGYASFEAEALEFSVPAEHADNEPTTETAAEFIDPTSSDMS